MTWIKTVPPTEDPAVAEAFAEVKSRYPPEYGPVDPTTTRLPEAVRDESITLAHSLIPAAMRHMMAGYAAMLDPKLPLSRRQHEMIAATVSAINRCFY
jgi:hypothetical protein